MGLYEFFYVNEGSECYDLTNKVRINDEIKVRINDEILDVNSSFDENKYIICKLKNIKKYVHKDKLTEDIGFWMSSELNKFPIYISEVLICSGENNEYKVNCWGGFSYSSWELNWTIALFTSIFYKDLEEKLKYRYDKFSQKNEIDQEYYDFEIECFIKDIDLAYEEVSEFIDILSSVYENTIEKLNGNNELSNCNRYIISLDSRIITPIKQYLGFFQEYVRKSKGIEVKFEVTTDNNNLNIYIGKDTNINIISEYLMEYVNFTKNSIDNINPEITRNISEVEKELLLVDLRNQIRFLETSIEIKNVKINCRDKEINRLEGFVNRFIDGEHNNVSLNVVSNNNLNSSVNINISCELEKLQAEIFNIKELLESANDVIREEINDIDKELMDFSEENIEDIKKRKSTFKKIARLLKKCNDPNSDLNKIIVTSKEAIIKVQNTAKIYNKFAQWLAIPQVPDCFLGE